MPAKWIAELDAALERLSAQGWVVIHRFVAAPVAPADVVEALHRYPDLDPDVLETYAAFDGVEVVVGTPLQPKGHYETVDAVRERSARFGGRFGVPGQIWGDGVAGPPIQEEFGGHVRSLELLPFAEVMDPHCDNFEWRGGNTTIHLLARLDDYWTFGLTRSEEIRLWRQPTRTRSHRPGYRDHDADRYQRALSKRVQEGEGRRVWWGLAAGDHSAALSDEGPLRWSEVFARFLRHLQHGTD